MADKRNRLFSSRFLAAINPHSLCNVACHRRLSSAPVTRIGHISMSAETHGNWGFPNQRSDNLALPARNHVIAGGGFL
jgi:hypothetical protein